VVIALSAGGRSRVISATLERDRSHDLHDRQYAQERASSSPAPVPAAACGDDAAPTGRDDAGAAIAKGTYQVKIELRSRKGRTVKQLRTCRSGPA
jgi:hypothetical protein